MSLKVVLVGARSNRQGTGPFIAAALAAAGARVSGIVGTSAGTVEAARQSLRDDWTIVTNGYTDLSRAMDAELPDAVAICSPWEFHAEQLALVAAAGCHCLVEKPLAWPATEAQVDKLVGAFEQRQLLLQLVTQWPATLPAFRELHGAVPAAIDQFTMRLSPISLGPTMVTDSAPHFVSMLQALLGPGECENSALTFPTDVDEHHSDRMALACDYHHAKGTSRGRLLLQTCQQRPRPAWYQINEHRADRQVELPAYRQYFTAGERRVALPDPMHQVVAEFVRRLASGDETDGELLRAGHRNLRQLAAAWL